MTRADDYRLEGLRLLLIHRTVGQVILNLNKELNQAKAQIDISQFAEALEGSAVLLTLSPEKLIKLSKSCRPGAGGEQSLQEGNDEMVVLGLEEAADGIRDVARAVSENDPDCLPSFVAGLVISWNAALSILHGSLQTLIQQYPDISPVLVRDDLRLSKAALAQREGAQNRERAMREGLEKAVTEEACMKKKRGEFDPNRPPRVATIAHQIAKAGIGLKASTISNKITAREIKDVWVRQVD